VLRYLCISIFMISSYACGSYDISSDISSDIKNHGENTDDLKSLSSDLLFSSLEDIQAGRLVAGEYLVAIKNTPPLPHIKMPSYLGSHRSHDSFLFETSQLWQEYLDSDVVLDLEPLTSLFLSGAPSPHDVSMRSHDMADYMVTSGLFSAASTTTAEVSLMKFASEEIAQRKLTELYAHGKIWFAEPNQRSNLHAEHAEHAEEELSLAKLRDSYNAQQELHYHISMTRLHKAFDYLAGLSDEEQQRVLARRPIIAVMDSGVDVEHPLLASKLVDLNARAASRIRACRGDRYGCNTSVDWQKGFLGDGSVYPVSTTGFSQRCHSSVDVPKIAMYCRHGTHVTGLAVAHHLQEGIYIYGSCPICQFVPVRIVDERLQIADSSIIRGLEYVSLVESRSGQKVDIINASFGKRFRSRSVAMAMHSLAERDHILMVAASGNADRINREYPSALKHAIAVTAIGASGKIYKKANYGGWVGVAAPGEYLWSTTPGSGIAFDHGTSMASPLVAGIAGLVVSLAKNPLTATQLRHILESSANSEQLYTDNPEFALSSHRSHVKKGSLGFGVVDAYAAVTSPYVHQPPAGEKLRISGCAVITVTDRSGYSFLFICLFLAPILIIPLSSFARSTRRASAQRASAQRASAQRAS